MMGSEIKVYSAGNVRTSQNVSTASPLRQRAPSPLITQSGARYSYLSLIKFRPAKFPESE